MIKFLFFGGCFAWHLKTALSLKSCALKICIKKEQLESDDNSVFLISTFPHLEQEYFELSAYNKSFYQKYLENFTSSQKTPTDFTTLLQQIEPSKPSVAASDITIVQLKRGYETHAVISVNNRGGNKYVIVEKTENDCVARLPFDTSLSKKSLKSKLRNYSQASNIDGEENYLINKKTWIITMDSLTAELIPFDGLLKLCGTASSPVNLRDILSSLLSQAYQQMMAIRKKEAGGTNPTLVFPLEEDLTFGITSCIEVDKKALL